MVQIVLDSNFLLFSRISWLFAHVTCRQVAALLIFAIPVFERVLRWVAQLTNGGAKALAEFDIELHGPYAVCVRIHKHPSKESKFSSAPPHDKPDNSFDKYCCTNDIHVGTVRTRYRILLV